MLHTTFVKASALPPLSLRKNAPWVPRDTVALLSTEGCTDGRKYDNVVLKES